MESDEKQIKLLLFVPLGEWLCVATTNFFKWKLKMKSVKTKDLFPNRITIVCLWPIFIPINWLRFRKVRIMYHCCCLLQQMQIIVILFHEQKSQNERVRYVFFYYMYTKLFGFSFSSYFAFPHGKCFEHIF